MTGLSFLLLGVFPEGDQAGKRGDQRAYTANVHAQQKLLVVGGKLRKQDRRRHIADDLAGGHGKQQCALFQ